MQNPLKPGDILSHNEMCSREGFMLQRGMNFRSGLKASVILMSRRSGAPYQDAVLDGGKTLIYEGHDVSNGKGVPNPKTMDQEAVTSSGKPTQNGYFLAAANAFKSGERPAELVRVYEKLRDGIWVFNGVFKLIDATQEESKRRRVFKFKLTMTEVDVSNRPTDETHLTHSRLIPSSVKLEVYKRDKGKCVLCGRQDNLHFDHDFPHSKGGTSFTAQNVRLLCVRHNLSKGAKIE